jgi:hypothetical protein
MFSNIISRNENGATAHNKQNTDAPFVDMALLNLWKEIVVVAQPAYISLRSIPAGCGVLLNVMRHWRRAEMCTDSAVVNSHRLCIGSWANGVWRYLAGTGKENE